METDLPPPPWPLEQAPEEIRRRLSDAGRLGRPAYPWPDVPVADWRVALAEVEAATSAVLSGRDAALLPRDRGHARALALAAFTAGMGPLLAAWSRSGALATDGELALVLDWHLAHGRARARGLAAELARVAAELGRAGVRPLVIKAGHTSRLYFPEPGSRPSADIDLVVPAGAWEACERRLAEAGYRRRAGQRHPRKSEWSSPGSPTRPRSLELAHAEDPRTIDLHDSLARDFFGVRTVRLPWRVVPAPPEIDAPVDVLEQPVLLLLHALHASEGFHQLTLIRLVELVLMARRDRASGALNDDEALAVLESTGAGRFLYPALALAERLAPGTFPPRLMEATTRAATPRLRRTFAGLSPAAAAQRPLAREPTDPFLWCASAPEYLRRVLYMAFPAPASTLPGLVRLYRERFYRIVRGTGGPD